MVLSKMLTKVFQAGVAHKLALAHLTCESGSRLRVVSWSVGAGPRWSADMTLLPSPLFYLSPPPAMASSPKLFPASPWEASYHALLLRAALLHTCLDKPPEPQDSPLDLSSSAPVSPPSSPFPLLTLPQPPPPLPPPSLSSPPLPTPSPLETEAQAVRTSFPPQPKQTQAQRRRKGLPG